MLYFETLRYYYKREILERVDGRRLVYKFGKNAEGWKEAAGLQWKETHTQIPFILNGRKDANHGRHLDFEVISSKGWRHRMGDTISSERLQSTRKSRGVRVSAVYGELQTYLFIVQSVQLKRVYFMKGYFSLANRGTSRRNEPISVLLLQRDETCDMQLFAETSRVDTLQFLYNFITSICPIKDLHFMLQKGMKRNVLNFLRYRMRK